MVIGLAAHRLPHAVRRRAILYGSGAAIALRIIFTALAAYLLQLPLLQLIGGAVLVYIAFKLLKPEDDSIVEAVSPNASVWEAVQTIALADVVMSLDNVLAIGGAAHGEFWLMLLGLAISMPLIAVGGGVVSWLMNTLPWLVFVGSGILAWTAGDMMLSDSFAAPYADRFPLVHYLVPAGITLLVIAAGLWVRRAKRAGPSAG